MGRMRAILVVRDSVNDAGIPFDSSDVMLVHLGQ